MDKKRQIRELSKRVTRGKDRAKSRKLCLLSVRILLGFAGRYEPRLISRQESMLDSRVGVILVDCRSEAEYSIVKIKNAKDN